MKENPAEQYRILLVEDDKNIATLFKYNLTKSGFLCDVAKNGQEGYDKAKAIRPDIIISDVMMPILNGFEFRKLLIDDPELVGIPFVFLTAKGEDDDILQGYDLSIEDYIIKSSSMKVVVAKVRAILSSLKKERSKAVEEVQKAADSMGAAVVPDSFPEFKGFEIKHWHMPYQSVPGGDFIDYYRLDDKHIAIILGDVMGKRWGAYYFAVAYAGYVRSAVRFVLQSVGKVSPSEILQKVNESIYNDERIAEVFITLSIVVINKSKMTAKYCGAGDLPLIFKSDKLEIIKSNGLLLGFKPDGDYRDSEIALKKGDSLFLLTDGIIETATIHGDTIGDKHLDKILKEIKPEDDSIEVIKKKLSELTGNKYQDDVSLISIKAV